MIEKCPNCNSYVTRDEVDIGVGVQYRPWGCDNCGFTEEHYVEKMIGLSIQVIGKKDLKMHDMMD